MPAPTRLALLIALFAGSAVQAGQPPSAQFALAPPDGRASLNLPGVDLDKALAEDRANLGKGLPLRYGLRSEVESVFIDGERSKGGEWQTLPDGRLLWRLEVQAPDVRSLDFGFSEFRLPADSELWLVSKLTGETRGPYTDADNPPSGQPFYTPFVVGDTAVLELVLPAHKRPFVKLRLDGATRAYRDVLQPWAVEKSGSCNVDVACPESAGWENQINSVGQYTFSSGGSSFVCTGQLLNNTAQNRSPIFSTANHCVSTQAAVGSIVVYWQYENPTCRTPGSPASGNPISKPGNSVAQTGGATLLATSAASDFTLTRLNANPPAAAQAYWSGWDRSGSAPASGVAIHHPQGHEKRISFENNPLTVSSYLGATGSGTTHWRVADWDLGTTEGGSSGSGLWNPAGLFIGQLHGGLAACGNNDADWYGRMSVSWTGGGTSASRMSDHLDPAGTGVQTLQGSGTCTPPAVTLSSTAFSGNPKAGDTLVFNAAIAAAGGAGAPYSISWNIDEDTGVDRQGGGTSLSVKYATATSTQVSVTVTDSAGCATTASRALDVGAANVVVHAIGTPTQICGNGNSAVNPGERWRVPVTLRNSGSAALGSGARALFANSDAGASALPLGPDTFGHRGATSADGGCGHQWIDIVSGTFATAALALNDADDGRALVNLQGTTPFNLYGQSVTQMVMSTNGYLAAGSADSGEDFVASCSAYDGSGPRLQVLHDDHVVGAGGGLRYRHFGTCPRAAQVGIAGQSCHVFTWTGLRPFGSTGNAEFQAILYPATGQMVYQYRTADANDAAEALIGIGDDDFSDGLTVGCRVEDAVTAGSSVCLYAPSNQPVSDSVALRLETPTVALPALAAGAQTTVNVDVAVPTDASCGAPFAVDFIAAADANSFSANPASVLAGVTLDGSCGVVSSCPAQIPARTERQGLYYNFGRGGNGVSGILYGAASGPRAFGGAWFTGDANRTPTWYLLGGIYADRLGVLDILRFTNSAAPGGFAPVNQNVGRAWFSWYGNQQVMMAWQFNDGRRGAELMGTLPLASTNRTQAYYNPGQSGWGVALDTAQLSADSSQEFWVNYFYDAAGQPIWALGSHSFASTDWRSFDLSTWRVHCPGCPQLTDWGSLTLPVGTQRRRWTGIGTGAIDTTITLPAPLSGTWNRTNLPIQALGPIQ